MTQPKKTALGERLGPVPGRPIRVVLLGGGPYLEQGVRLLLSRLEAEPQIDLAGALLQSQAQSGSAIVRDLWRRRRWLAPALLLDRMARIALRAVRSPRQEHTLRKTLDSLSQRLHFVPDVHAPSVLQRLRDLDCDLGLVYGSPILGPELFEIPRFGCIGIHHGRLPEYRGKKTTFWAMARGEQTAGVTIQRIGAGLDTGAVLKKGEVPTIGRSYARVWKELEQLGVDLFVEAVLEVQRGEAVCTPVAGKKGPLYRDPKISDLLSFHWQRLIGQR